MSCQVLSTICCRAVPTATSEASVMTQRGASGFGWDKSVAIGQGVFDVVER